MSIIATFRALYTKPNEHRAERLTTLLPLAQRARDLRDEHASILRAAGDLAHDVASLNVASIALYLKPDLMPLVHRAYAAAKEIANAGTPVDAMAAIRTSEHGIDSHTDSEYTYRFNDAKRLVDLLDGAVAALKKFTDEMVSALAQLDRSTPLTSGLVTVPPRTEFGHPNLQPATPAASSSVE